ncbi:unnamed protein product [Darwinula stevensoni]|uniref:Sodium channel protein Nach n=1 Tax=Darwinula stevensoni TaxID=69355 RepID=A0A7R9AGI9_9CRUS|nr:unnamed protein product [Darwinula stevensoni]CAG0903465.1 unnamed protein product [Darwinula stevensoni]
MVMGKKVSIAREVYCREADIQFEDEGETVGVGPVTVKFLQRFSGHGLSRSAYIDSSRLRKTVWLLVFVIASGYMVSGIIDVLMAFIDFKYGSCLTFNFNGAREGHRREKGKSSSTNGMRITDGLQLILTSRVANRFRLLIHPPGIQDDNELEKGYEVNLGTISHVPTKKVVLQRLLPNEGGNCAPDTYLEKRFDMNMFDLEYKYANDFNEVCRLMCLADRMKNDSTDLCCFSTSFWPGFMKVDKTCHKTWESGACYNFTKEKVPKEYFSEGFCDCPPVTCLENLAVVNVYYETFAVEIITEHLQYPWSTFIGMLGGILGLYTGLSFISILEVMEWIFNIIFHGWRKPRHEAMGPKRRVLITWTDKKSEPEFRGPLVYTLSPLKETQNAGFDLASAQRPS